MAVVRMTLSQSEYPLVHENLPVEGSAGRRLLGRMSYRLCRALNSLSDPTARCWLCSFFPAPEFTADT